MRRGLALHALFLACGVARWLNAQTPRGRPPEPAKEETPLGPKWRPSEWGPADQRGAANRLTADKVHEFAFVFEPLRLKGANGSPGNPLAIR
jgi:hypothetical protein